MAIVEKLTAIGDAIREKTGSTAKLTLDQMVNEIEGIPAGGGGDTSMEDALISHSYTESSYANDRITKLGYGAFYGNQNLKSIDLPNVTELESYVFLGCEKLSELNLPKLKIIGGYAFAGRTLVIPPVNFPNVTRLDVYAYNGSPGVTVVDLPSLTMIGSNAFYGCTNLTSVSMPLLTNSGDYTYQGCSKLTTVNLPNVTLVGSATFQGCSSLVKLDFPMLTSIAGWSPQFSGCSSLTTFIIRTTGSVVSLSMHNAFDNTPIAKGTGYIYVPDELVEDYKAATNWAKHADQIKPLSEYVEVS